MVNAVKRYAGLTDTPGVYVAVMPLPAEPALDEFAATSHSQWAPAYTIPNQKGGEPLAMP